MREGMILLPLTSFLKVKDVVLNTLSHHSPIMALSYMDLSMLFFKKIYFPSALPLVILEKALTAIFQKDDGSICFLQSQP